MPDCSSRDRAQFDPENELSDTRNERRSLRSSSFVRLDSRSLVAFAYHASPCDREILKIQLAFAVPDLESGLTLTYLTMLSVRELVPTGTL